MKRAILSCVLLAGFATPSGAWSSSLARQSAAAVAQATPVSRKVSGLTLTSDEAPRVRIKFDKGFKYVGGQSFVLYDVANAEQHFFVDADARGRVRRLYWVQFEGYLPGNTHKYNYKLKNVVAIGGLDFFADSQARQIPAPDPAALASRPANKISDGDHARTFLASKGLALASNEALWQRLVHMTDATNRSELMIIYLEDLSGTGLTAADLGEGGKAARWESMSKELLERAREGMTISRR
jgi:hypothetical protein